MRKTSFRWRRGLRAGWVCALLASASACDDEPRWTWAEWVQFDAGLRVPEASVGDGGARDGAVPDGSLLGDGGVDAALDSAVDGEDDDVDAGSADEDAEPAADAG